MKTAAREALGWTHAEIAETLGIAERTPYRYANGEVHIPEPPARHMPPRACAVPPPGLMAGGRAYGWPPRQSHQSPLAAPGPVIQSHVASSSTAACSLPAKYCSAKAAPAAAEHPRHSGRRLARRSRTCDFGGGVLSPAGGGVKGTVRFPIGSQNCHGEEV